MGLLQASLLLLFIYAFILHRIRKFVNKNAKIIYKIKFQQATASKIKILIKKIKRSGDRDSFRKVMILCWQERILPVCL